MRSMCIDSLIDRVFHNRLVISHLELKVYKVEDTTRSRAHDVLLVKALSGHRYAEAFMRTCGSLGGIHKLRALPQRVLGSNIRKVNGDDRKGIRPCFSLVYEGAKYMPP